MFLSLFIILFFGVIGGYIFEKIHLPKLIWYLILGILIGPSIFNIVDEKLLEISSYLRQIALVIILTRSGLSLDIDSLKKIGRPALLMCFVPACFEILGIFIFAPLLLNISHIESLLLGSVLAAVSPAIVVPRMIKIKEENYGVDTNISELVLAGASCDDIFVIVLFYSFKSLVSSNNFNTITLLNIPCSIFLGITAGFIIGLLLSIIFKHINVPTEAKVIIILGISFGLLTIESAIKQYISFSSLLGIIVIGIIINRNNKVEAKQIENKYKSLWSGFEILLFSLVGCIFDIKTALSSEGAIIVGLILISLCFRSLGVLVCLIKTNYNIKEKLFIVLSYIPKATVQASIGAIAINEGLACGNIVLIGAIVSILLSAPLGAILIDKTYKKLLSKTNLNYIE